MDITKWIVPNYSLVDVHAYEMGIYKRRRIEDFCIQFFKDLESTEHIDTVDVDNDTTKFLVRMCQRLVREEEKFREIMKTLPARLSLENFTGDFQEMCNILFKGGTDVRDEYVISLLVFSTELHRVITHGEASYAWYDCKLLLISLSDALERAGFNPCTFKYHEHSSGILRTIITSFIITVPALLFFYIVCK